jgi:hypothetical protein
MNAESAESLKIEGANFPSSLRPPIRARVNQVQAVALIVGLVSLGLTAFGAFTQRTQFFYSYLFGYIFWLGLSLGCFLVTMIHTLTGGRWGYPTRRFLEAGYLVLPLMLVLVIPIFFGLRELYPWARPQDLAAEKVLQQRHAYLNTWTYILRTVVFLGLWTWMSLSLRKWSLEQDRTVNAEPTRKARILSGPGIVIYGLLGTFAFIDWVMSLETHWYSTMYAVIIIIGQILVTFAFCVVMLSCFRDEEPWTEVVTRNQYHQLGNLLLAFVMFWTYVQFGQLLIVYSGDKPHEVDWYLHRIAGNWKLVVAALALFHFFLPFFLLLFRAVKKHFTPLTILSAVLFVVHIVAVYWLVMPALHHDGLAVSWLDFTAPLGIGGLWLAYFLSRFKAAPVLPQHDPGLQFAFQYEH